MQKEQRDACDIAIVGGGLVGASLALALAQNADIQLTLLEANSLGGTAHNLNYEGNCFDPRVVALSPASKALLESLDVWSLIEARRACPYFTMEVWDGEGTGKVDFDCRDSHQSHLGHIVENSVIVSALWEKLAECKNIQCVTGAKISFAELGVVKYALEKEEHEKEHSLTSTLIIAADGPKSAMRDYFEVATREWDYQQSAIVCTVRTELAHDFSCKQRFTQSGPIAFLPLCIEPYKAPSEQYYSSLVWSIDEQELSSIMALEEEAFCQSLSRAFEYSLGRVVEASERFSFPLKQRHAKDYIQKGFALVGDAAHTMHPLAGQGVNLGLADVTVLQEELLRATQLGLPLDNFSILQRYQRRRKAQNLAAMAAMEGFKRLYGSDDLALRWLRNTGMNIFNSQLWLKREIGRLASGSV